jgi:hypothetical protein
MKRLLLSLALTVSLFGCATHFYKTEDDLLHFFLKKPEAKTVLFASSLDGYEQHPTERVGKGTWEITVLPVADFKYFYIVDGSVYLPECMFAEKDDFGSEICIYERNL